MSVFTTVSADELKSWLQAYPLGDLLELEGIASGISNTNYFVTTSTGKYVLTLFEEHNPEELPYFLDLMTHLAAQGIPCPNPVKRVDGKQLDMLNGKPAALVSCLKGGDVSKPTSIHCAQVGQLLARMHLAGLNFIERVNDLKIMHSDIVSELTDGGTKYVPDLERKVNAIMRPYGESIKKDLSIAVDALDILNPENKKSDNKQNSKQIKVRAPDGSVGLMSQDNIDKAKADNVIFTPI
jgi:homoserine kinase